jgi:hypothetical protein
MLIVCPELIALLALSVFPALTSESVVGLEFSNPSSPESFSSVK